MKISIKINHLLDIFHQYLISIKFNPTSFSLIKKILDCGNYFFKKPQLSKLNNKPIVSNLVQSNEKHYSLHDYSRMGFLDDCNAIHSNNNHFIKDVNPIVIISNRYALTSNSDAIVLPLPPVSQNHSTISLKEVYENLVKSNTAKLKTHQLFEKMYEQRCSDSNKVGNICVSASVNIGHNDSFDIEKSLSNPLFALYPIHYFKNIEELDTHSEDLNLSKNTTESQNLDSSDSNNFENMAHLKDSNDVGTGCSLSTTTNHPIKYELDSYHLDNNVQSVSDNVGNTNFCQSTLCVAEAITSSYALSAMPMVNHNDNDVEQSEVVLDDCSEEMQTLVSNFSLNLKSVTDHNPIELTVKHPLFSVSYENNPYFSIKYTPHIGYNSLMELEQDKELMIFPLCFYIKSVSSTQDNTNYKVFFLLEEQIDEDNDLSLDYVDNVHSGRIGLIYVSKSDIRKKYNVKRITQKIQDEVKLEAIRFVQLLNQ